MIEREDYPRTSGTLLTSTSGQIKVILINCRLSNDFLQEARFSNAIIYDYFIQLSGDRLIFIKIMVFKVASKILVLGLDGACYEWLLKFTPKTIEKITERGWYAIARSLIPPTTPVAWTSIFTGVWPTQHGIWNFYNITRGNIVNIYDSEYPLLWEILDELNVPTTWLWIPMSHPVQKLSSKTTFFSGPPYPSGREVDAKLVKNSISPRDFRNSLLKKFDVIKLYSRSRSLKDLCKKIEVRGEVLKEVLKSGSKLVFSVIPETDHVWHIFNSISIGMKVYRKADEIVEDLILESARYNYEVVLVSDHGLSLIHI